MGQAAAQHGDAHRAQGRGRGRGRRGRVQMGFQEGEQVVRRGAYGARVSRQMWSRSRRASRAWREPATPRGRVQHLGHEWLSTDC
ncbi:hypothetical protein DF19_32295 [Streptomyces olindensis]|nr:hypothetical protein DF19_32295 [Streptomyces olindensis]